MTLQLVGAARLTQLMRTERARDLDTSWLLFGPEEEAQAVEDDFEPLKYAAE